MEFAAVLPVDRLTEAKRSFSGSSRARPWYSQTWDTFEYVEDMFWWF